MQWSAAAVSQLAMSRDLCRKLGSTPVPEIIAVPVNHSVLILQCVQTREPLRVQQLAQIVQTVQLMPHVQLDEIVLRSGDGQRR